MNLAGKTSVITGATSGLGREIAIELAKRNSNLLVIGQNPQKLENLTVELKKLGAGQITARAINFSDRSSVEEHCKDASLAFPSFDYVFCSAGVKFEGPCREISLSKLEDMMSVNYFSTVILIKALVSKIAKGGHVFIVSSGAANFGIFNDSGYCSSKAALERYAEALHSELDSDGIRVTTVSPGPMETGMFREAVDYNGRKSTYTAGKAADPRTRALQMINHIGKGKFRLDLSINAPMGRILATFAPSILDGLVKRKK